MAQLDDLASAYRTLADAIGGVDAAAALNETDTALDAAAALGASELTAALESFKEAGEKIRDQLGALADQAATASEQISGMT